MFLCAGNHLRSNDYWLWDILWHFIGSFQTPDLKGTQDVTKQRGNLSSIFSSAQPAPVFGNADLWYHLSRLRQNAQHISCRVMIHSMKCKRAEGIKNLHPFVPLFPLFVWQNLLHSHSFLTSSSLMCIL